MSDVPATETSTQTSAETDVSLAQTTRDSSEAIMEAQASGIVCRLSYRLSSTDYGLDHVPDVYEIIPEGDLILLVGRDQTRIQLTRDLLCKASPVFVDLLKSRNIIGSGASRDRDTPYIFALPDDDPVVFRTACDMLYAPSSKTHDLYPEAVRDVILLALKYQMFESFEYPAAYWFRNTSPATLDCPDGPGHCWYLMMATYWIGWSTDFFDFSARLVTETSDSLVEYVSRTKHTVIELQICCKIIPLTMLRI
ncbi:hypothetical protein FSARC_3890 [Fusarium sarcochroum]|uniref:BTB domain-containing protein n=1 Tax=Fusarium sarcochroum TaxID=1208366 RepID=A0A8H4XC37_9HYPO|nr:hypothetical protein FSARC_3890 [Fusarium sarcochroum]